MVYSRHAHISNAPPPRHDGARFGIARPARVGLRNRLGTRVEARRRLSRHRRDLGRRAVRYGPCPGAALQRSPD